MLLQILYTVQLVQDSAQNRPAMLRLLDPQGHIVAVDTLERPRATMKRLVLHGNVPTYFVTVDLTNDMGSYSGPSTSAIEVQDGRLRPVFVLASTGKQDWRMLDDPYTGGKKFHVVSCHPDFKSHVTGDSLPFVIEYSTIRFDDREWRTYTRTEPGFWESDHGWPVPAKFPQ